MAVGLKAWGRLDKTVANSQMLPEGSVIPVKGTNKQTVYFASHGMPTFQTDNQVKVFGRVLDENGLYVNDVSTNAISVT